LVLTPDSTSSIQRHFRDGSVQLLLKRSCQTTLIQVNEVMCDTVTTGREQTRVNHCAVIYDEDSDFRSVDVIDTDQYQQPELLPSQRIDLNTLSHLLVQQRTKLLALLDKYSECFSEKPGLCIPQCII